MNERKFDQRGFSRRDFLATTAMAAAGAGLSSIAATPASEPVIDIHQHVNYGGKRDKQWNQIAPARSDAQLIEHQHNMGVTRTILLPAGRPCIRASTHEGFSNGLEATCTGNEACYALAQAHPESFWFGSNEVPDLEDAPRVIEEYLKKGAVVIAEQKFGVECDSPQMQELYQLAADYKVPILMHWQYGTYNYGYERFHKMLEKFPQTTFIGHAQTFWANIEKDYNNDSKKLYPKGKVTPGGLTDRYLTDYPNFVGDLSAGSGNNALTRDPDHARGFLERHQNQLVFGSDCPDRVGHGEICTGWSTIQAVRKLAPSKTIERKLLYENALRIYRL
jgi:predicted TIM-barrel fold metal-dependent hydrolase